MGNFLTISYWVNMHPRGLAFSGTLFFLVLILSFISIIFLFSIAKKRKNNVYFRIWNKLNVFAVTNLFISLFLLFFEYEEVYIFSSRLWLLLWVISMFVWLIFIASYYRKIPEIKKEYAKKAEFNKYIP